VSLEDADCENDENTGRSRSTHLEEKIDRVAGKTKFIAGEDRKTDRLGPTEIAKGGETDDLLPGGGQDGWE